MSFKLDIALTPEELERYLAEQRTVRIATIGADGPQVVPFWFAWHDGALFWNTTLGNLTVRNIERDPRAAATVDDGDTYEELRGVTIRGRAQRADADPRIPQVERVIGDKYLAGNEPPYRRWRSRAWFRLDAEHVASWDFRKIPAARARRDAERARRGGA